MGEKPMVAAVAEAVVVLYWNLVVQQLQLNGLMINGNLLSA
jgi:hypothetical protein